MSERLKDMFFTESSINKFADTLREYHPTFYKERFLKFFTESSINKFADTLREYHPTFYKERFLNLIFTEAWEALELKERMRHTTLCLHEVLPGDYLTALEILKKAAPNIKGFEAMVLPDYVELYGMENWESSLNALGHFTKYCSSEFAIRPFLDEDPEKTMTYMHKWAEDRDENVRRLASEGCRPRLPWAMALPKFKKDPSLIFPILEKLKNDDSEFVRKSVANNLNDISKDNPDLMLGLCEKWIGKSDKTDKIIKHACRSLLKAGNKRALLLFGYGDPETVHLEDFVLNGTSLAIGDTLHYSFKLTILGEKVIKVRVDCAIDYMKTSGKQSRKVFKIAEGTYKPGEHLLKRKQPFADMSTRTHTPGEHRITIFVNGEGKATSSFELR
jgi:3-methyladenine DNA glycosylase AlkC